MKAIICMRNNKVFGCTALRLYTRNNHALGIWYNCFRRKRAFKTKAIKERQLPVSLTEKKRILDVIYRLSRYI